MTFALPQLYTATTFCASWELLPSLWLNFNINRRLSGIRLQPYHHIKHRTSRLSGIRLQPYHHIKHRTSRLSGIRLQPYHHIKHRTSATTNWANYIELVTRSDNVRPQHSSAVLHRTPTCSAAATHCHLRRRCFRPPTWGCFLRRHRQRSYTHWCSVLRTLHITKLQHVTSVI